MTMNRRLFLVDPFPRLVSDFSFVVAVEFKTLLPVEHGLEPQAGMIREPLKMVYF
jgi:hypothetical protein